MSYTVTLNEMHQTPTVVVVGCGGTGGFVAEDMCRLLIHSDMPLMLVDHDRVDPHNLCRQNFFPEDVGKFKAQALADRLARNYGRKIAYSVMPYDKDMFDEDWGTGMRSKAMNLIIIGCVDNTLARRAISQSQHFESWWLDAGNGHHSGQVLLGNARDPEALNEAFDLQEHTVRKLPLPSLQLPSLLIPPAVPLKPRDCAQAVEDEEQSPTINRAMATLVMEFMYRLLSGKLSWMGAYLDLETATLQPVPADPKTVARMLGVKENLLMHNKCALGNRYHL